MAVYTQEPRRRNCVYDLDVGVLYGNAVLDNGPRRNDGVVSGDPVQVTGVDGRAIQFRGNSYLSVPIDVDSITSVTASIWVRFGDEENQTDNPVLVSDGGDFSVHADASGSGVELSYSVQPSAAQSATTVSHTVDRGEWHHVVAYRHESDVVLLVDGVAVAEGQTTNSGELSPDVTLYSGGGIGSDSLRDTSIDNPRLYSTDLSRGEIDDVREVVIEHILVDEVGEQWGTEGIPYRQTNRDFGGVLADPKGAALRQIDFILESRHIDTATGNQLDRIGAVAGVQRREGESNPKYRARIRATIAAGRSSGTFSDIINVAASIVGADQDQVELREEFDTQPATAILYIHTSVFEESELTPTDVADVIDDLVVAGHEINVIRTSENAFTVRGDAQTNDPLLGFTSDEVSTGGGLAQDL